MKTNKFKAISTKFNQLAWHDSEVLSFFLTKNDLGFDLEITVNLFEANGINSYEKNIRVIRFKQCRVITMDLDLLGMKLCGGAISSAICHTNSTDFELKRRNKIHEFDLPQENLPLKECLVFEIEMIHPTGNMIIFAKDFETLGID